MVLLMKEEISERMLKILVCPSDKSKLEYNEKKTHLICSTCGNKYEVKDGIPVFLD
jgi:uncharacterized protein YbaR (Trm112 family)